MPIEDRAQLEQQTQSIGRDLYARATALAETSGFLSGQEDAMMKALMGDEALRVQMLRFTDALPALTDDRSLTQHLREYLGDQAMTLPLPGLGKIASWSIAHSSGKLASKAMATAVRTAVQQMARRFIAGDNVDTAAKAMRKLHDDGMGFTVDMLGEVAVSEAEADAYQRQYLYLLEQLSQRVRNWPEQPLLDEVSGRRSPRLNLSVKLSSLCSQLDPVHTRASVETLANRLRPVLYKAREVGAFITFDMEHYDMKDITLDVFQSLLMEPQLRDWPDVGIAMQAYLRDTPGDLERMIAWAKQRGAPVTIRLVRGAYWDFETVIARQHGWPVPVWTSKDDTDATYEAGIERLLENWPHVEIAIATHNLRSIAHGLAVAGRLGHPAERYEFQMIYGMADPVKRALVEMNQRLRVYLPFGELIPGMSYFVRRLLENTSSQSFLRMGFVENAPVEELFAPPQPTTAYRDGQPQRPGKSGPSATESEPGPTFSNEPVRRFVRPAEREAFGKAIDTVRSQLGREVLLRIGGESRQGNGLVDSVNPSALSEVVVRAAQATPNDARDAIGVAAEAFTNWRRTPAHERAQVLLTAAGLMRQRRDELSAWMVLEAGKPWREADADVAEAIDFLTYYARQAMRLAPGHNLSAPGEINRYVYEPRGVAAVIAPWNFPLAILTGMTSAAIVTGNTAVVKPAPQTPGVAAQLFDILSEAGLPPGVANLLPGPDEAGEALVVDPRTHMIIFTGSRAVGCLINRLAAEVHDGQHHIKQVIAEMGGKNAVIIDRDADMDDAVRGVAFSAYGYAGQKCSAASRAIIVGRDAYDAFVSRFPDAARSLRVGPAHDPATYVPPVIDAEAHERISRAIETGKAHGRLLVETDVSHLRDGYYIGPTAFADVDPQSPLAQEEIFGPVLAIMQARSFDEAIDIANGTAYGLTAGVYSRSPANLARASNRLHAGNVYLNRKITGAIVNRQPFGGLKLSGVGSKAGGPDYLRQFTEPRVITENTIRRGFAPDDDLLTRLDDPGGI